MIEISATGGKCVEVRAGNTILVLPQAEALDVAQRLVAAIVRAAEAAASEADRKAAAKIARQR